MTRIVIGNNTKVIMRYRKESYHIEISKTNNGNETFYSLDFRVDKDKTLFKPRTFYVKSICKSQDYQVIKNKFDNLFK